MSASVTEAAARVSTGRPHRTSRRVMPGFRLTLGYTIFWLSLIVLLPLGALVLKASEVGLAGFKTALMNPLAVSAYKLSFGAALIAGLINAVFGVIVAWVLARYRFPGKSLVDALVDLPFALPTAVAGLALTAVYSEHGWVGRYLEPHGIKVAYTRVGVVVAMVFVGVPFVIRTVEPVLSEIEAEVEEVAAVLGASRFTTIRRVILPAIFPALLTGFALAFARGLGEYGSIVFISGNMPMKTEIAPQIIRNKLEADDYAGATAVAVVMLAASLLILLAVNLFQAWSRRRLGGGRSS